MNEEETKKSITKSINDWLLKYKKITEFADEIHTEELEDSNTNLALQRSGVEEMPNKYVGEKCWYRQYNYILFLKNYSESDEQRLENLDWLDDFSDWINQQNRDRNYPTIKNKKVIKIGCSDEITYQTDEKGTVSNYYIQLYFLIKGGI